MQLCESCQITSSLHYVTSGVGKVPAPSSIDSLLTREVEIFL